jgi:hypothetical protein
MTFPPLFRIVNPLIIFGYLVLSAGPALSQGLPFQLFTNSFGTAENFEQSASVAFGP